MKIVINVRFGGFGLSDLACEELSKRKSYEVNEYDFEDDFDLRTDKDLIEVVETLKEEANGAFANLKIIEIPDDVNWTIEEYDGKERVEEVHRVWY
jgi:hypothetical protein